MGIIVSSFPGCGKTYMSNVYGDKAKFLDLTEGIGGKIEDPSKYVDEVMENVPLYDIVFVSINEQVMNELDSRNIDYDVFYPSKERRFEFIENHVRKRAKPKTIQTLDINFDKWIDAIEENESETCYKHKLNNNGEFIGNNAVIMQYLNTLKNNE